MGLDFGELERKNKSEEEDNFNPEDIYNNDFIDLEAQEPPPPIAISMGDDGYGKPVIFGTYGNISLIKAEEKARKSWLKSLIEACCLGDCSEYTNGFEIKSHNLGDRYLVSLDTEQDKFYAGLNARRIKKMLNRIPENYKYFYLRKRTPSQRVRFLKWLFYESPLKGKIGIIVLDGYKDFVRDFNNLAECEEFTQTLMTISHEFDCHITGMLHVNSGTDKAKGFIGSFIQEKSETITQLKDEGKYSKVFMQKGRGIKFDEFYLSVEDHLPKIIDAPDYKVNKNDKDKPFKT